MKKRDVIAWGVWSIFLSPVPIFIIVALLPKLPASSLDDYKKKYRTAFKVALYGILALLTEIKGFSYATDSGHFPLEWYKAFIFLSSFVLIPLTIAFIILFATKGIVGIIRKK